MERVTRNRIGSMPFLVEMAMAHALLARRMRHVARCNCGKGKAGPDCTTVHPYPSEQTERAEEAAERSRARMNEYRANRVWRYDGGQQKG